MIAAWLAFVAAPVAQTAESGVAATGSVPFVGCASDGQSGPLPAPPMRPVPVVPAEAAPRLAYYATEHMGVLAPRGWHCLGLYGSNGSILIVTPDRRGFDDLRHLRGPAVQLALSDGATSGRFAVARKIARLFPGQIAFARQVAAEGIDTEPLPSGPYAGDRLVHHGPEAVEYLTPARTPGLGTESRLDPDDRPVTGIVTLLPDDGDGPSAVQLSVRLSAEQEPLAAVILAEELRLRRYR